MEYMYLHEGIPGHHFQISIANKIGNLPRFRKYAWTIGFGEGWALYAESLGKELGLYKDPYSYYGMLSGEMLRAIRLVVDAGIHAKGWSRDEAVKYFTDNSSSSENLINSEVNRYIVLAGTGVGL